MAKWCFCRGKFTLQNETSNPPEGCVLFSLRDGNHHQQTFISPHQHKTFSMSEACLFNLEMQLLTASQKTL